MEFKIIENGKVIDCKSILEFRDDGNDKNYIVYTESGSDEIFASRYDIENDQVVLKEIETEYEWNMIDNLLMSRGDLNE